MLHLHDNNNNNSCIKALINFLGFKKTVHANLVSFMLIL